MEKEELKKYELLDKDYNDEFVKFLTRDYQPLNAARVIDEAFKKLIELFNRMTEERNHYIDLLKKNGRNNNGRKQAKSIKRKL